MKNFAIGCAAVLVILTVAGVGVVWFKFGDDISAGIDAVQGVAKLAPQFEELNESIDNRAGYTPPVDGELGEDTFQRFLAAQRQMRSELEGRLEELQSKYDALEKEIDERGGQAGVSDMMGAYGDLSDLLIDAKRAQVEAINDQNFSLQEYNWVRDQVYRAIGESVAVAAVAANPNASGEFQASVPETTREMVEPHREELMKAHVLAWWGL
ncbi:MAG TPA: hypothetical protein VKO85_03270 [Wenzhouxiangellaceae bacterium]|nr:hypothetical protein [Wenzhouxiangellaceae bacterium]